MEQGLAYQLGVLQKSKERSPLELLTGGDYGFRHNSSQPKGEGWLGNVSPVPRNPITEWSVNVDGRNIPTLVPGLTKEQVQRIVLDASGSKQNLDDVIDKAVKFADDRAQLGYKPYKD